MEISKVTEMLKRVPAPVVLFCEAVRAQGGRSWLVGGSVRDLVCGQEPKDWDLEVFGLPSKKLVRVMSGLGSFHEVGRSFGVFKGKVEGLELDVALPRTEKKSGVGHLGFEVSSDENLSTEQASMRRDFTMNAMMFDPLAGELLDYHLGVEDLANGLLRHVSPAFDEDPLRPLRAMQFAARFKLIVTDETARRCASLLSEAETLSGSRCWAEWEKWALSDYPDYGLVALRKSGWLSLYLELQQLIGCEQNERWHPEGDVWTHTVQVVSSMARLCGERGFAGRDRLILMLAALCHDLGKPLTTRRNEEGEIVATGHAKAGIAVAESLLSRISAPKSVVEKVLLLVQEHGAHFADKLSDRVVLRLAHRLDSVSIRMWECLTEADASGCSPRPAERPALVWLQRAEQLKVDLSRQKAVVEGKTLIKWGMQPSVKMGELIDKAYCAQMDGLFDDERSARQWFEQSGVATSDN